MQQKLQPMDRHRRALIAGFCVLLHLSCTSFASLHPGIVVKPTRLPDRRCSQSLFRLPQRINGDADAVSSAPGSGET